MSILEIPNLFLNGLWIRMRIVKNLTLLVLVTIFLNDSSSADSFNTVLIWIMNEWCIYIALYCVLLYMQSALQTFGGVSPQPPPVCSIYLNDATAATGQRRQCAHHTPATGGEEREIEQIKWMGIIRRPWLTRASGGNLSRTPGLHPYSLREVPWEF